MSLIVLLTWSDYLIPHNSILNWKVEFKALELMVFLCLSEPNGGNLEMINHEVKEGRDHCIPFSLLFFICLADFEIYLFMFNRERLPSNSFGLGVTEISRFSYLNSQYPPSCLGVTSKTHFFFFCLPSKFHCLLSSTL